MRAAREKADPGDAAIFDDNFVPPLDPIYEEKQSKEIQKLCFTELKLFDYLITGFAQL